MRLLTWNVGHQTRRKELPPRLAVGICDLSPDYVVLTEYVYDDAHRPFLAELAAAGICHCRVSAYVPGQNQVLIASRLPIEEGDLYCTVGLSEATEPNWLHVQSTSLDVVGLRRPMFKRVPRAVSQYWGWVVTAVERLRSRPSVLVGDFNTGANSRAIRRMASTGWQIATPEGWSFRSKKGEVTAIDHALVSPTLRIVRAAYEQAVGSCIFAGTSTAYSDHAILHIDVEPSDAAAHAS